MKILVIFHTHEPEIQYVSMKISAWSALVYDYLPWILHVEMLIHIMGLEDTIKKNQTSLKDELKVMTSHSHNSHVHLKFKI